MSDDPASPSKEEREARIWVAKAALLMLGFIFTVYMLSQCAEDVTARKGSRTTVATVPQSVTGPQAKIVPHRVIRDEAVGTAKRSLVVEVQSELNKLEARSLADALRNQDSRRFDATFIEVNRNGRLWATAHFNPTLKVVISGANADAIPRAKKVKGQKAIGEWIDDRPYVGHVVSIYREKGRYFSKRTTKDGVIGPTPLKKEGSVFWIDPELGHDESYVIRKDGRLELRGPEGVDSVFEKR